MKIIEKTNRLHCGSCDTDFEVGPDSIINWDIRSESDIDDAYEFIECCTDPFLKALIVSDKPLFVNDHVNQDAFIQGSPVRPPHADTWVYEVDEVEEEVLSNDG